MWDFSCAILEKDARGVHSISTRNNLDLVVRSLAGLGRMRVDYDDDDEDQLRFSQPASEPK